MAVGSWPAVFIDKDGTLIDDVPYNVDPELIRLSKDAGTALARLRRAGYRLIVVSNQSGVARGYFKKGALAAVNHRIQQLLEPYAVAIDDFYYCPHGTDDACSCRKPQPGMLLKAAREYTIDLEKSWMIGDILHDVEAGNRAGCRTIHLDNGHETEWVKGPHRRPDVTVRNLREAANIICNYSKERRRNEQQVSYHY